MPRLNATNSANAADVVNSWNSLNSSEASVIAVDLVGSGLTYAEIWDLQKFYVEEIRLRRQPEMILFCEHEAVITAGRRARPENLLSSACPVYQIERGGDYTWHGPGQLVIYPLTRIQERWKGLRGFLKGLESLTGQLLTERGLSHCEGPATGVWLNTRERNDRPTSRLKVASIGVAVRHWISYHGIALNISNRLSDFSAIRPCDFEASVMTSLEREGIAASVSEIRDDFLRLWQERFNETVSLQSWLSSSRDGHMPILNSRSKWA